MIRITNWRRVDRPDLVEYRAQLNPVSGGPGYMSEGDSTMIPRRVEVYWDDCSGGLEGWCVRLIETHFGDDRECDYPIYGPKGGRVRRDCSQATLRAHVRRTLK